MVGPLREIKWWSSGTISSGVMVQPYIFPVDFRPTERTAVAASSGNSAREAAAHLDPDGKLYVYNASGGSSPVRIHSLYTPAS